jgi:hypothetical protein
LDWEAVGGKPTVNCDTPMTAAWAAPLTSEHLLSPSDEIPEIDMNWLCGGKPAVDGDTMTMTVTEPMTMPMTMTVTEPMIEQPCKHKPEVRPVAGSRTPAAVLQPKVLPNPLAAPAQCSAVQYTTVQYSAVQR